MALPFRQIHLDFHTAPAIRDVGIDFDADGFIRTLVSAHVNSITVFARCHHGYSYYPTRIGAVHPGLKRDLLGEMVSACRSAGIRVCAYTTVVWDELAWATHPEWRQVGPDGRTVGVSDSPLKPGWKNLCMNTGYADYVVAQIEEFLDLYPVDGVFIDIVRYLFQRCACATCLSQMVAEGVNPQNPTEIDQFALRAERRFMERTAAAIRARKPGAGIFFNSRLQMNYDSKLGNRPEIDSFSHLEIESLPGGFWGYDHFPLHVRYFQTFDRELVAMTGRFHTAWGDFGGLRNRAALEFECFQALAHGAAISIGDQLHPRGRLDAAVYQRIGEVFAAVEQRESWCRDTRPTADIGVYTTSGLTSETGEDHISPAADLGTLHILEQLKHQFVYLDSSSDLSPYALVIVPEGIVVDAALADRLRAYLRAGGRLLISGVGTAEPGHGDFQLAAEMGAHYAGPARFAPDYLMLGEALADGVEATAHSCELPGVQLMVGADVTELAHSGAPYFNRTWEHFCSHQYSPLDRVTDEPIIIQNGNVITLARPLFREYALSSKRVHRTVIANCIRRLLPYSRVGVHNLPSTAVVTVRARESDLIVHILHYVHQRRGRTLDIIEDTIPLYDVEVSIRVDRRPESVRLVPEETAIDWEYADGYVRLRVPRVAGYQIVQIENAHAAAT